MGTPVAAATLVQARSAVSAGRPCSAAIARQDRSPSERPMDLVIGRSPAARAAKSNVNGASTQRRLPTALLTQCFGPAFGDQLVHHTWAARFDVSPHDGLRACDAVHGAFEHEAAVLFTEDQRSAIFHAQLAAANFPARSTRPQARSSIGNVAFPHPVSSTGQLISPCAPADPRSARRRSPALPAPCPCALPRPASPSPASRACG